jgi:hypothetical protein
MDESEARVADGWPAGSKSTSVYSSPVETLRADHPEDADRIIAEQAATIQVSINITGIPNVWALI